MEWRRKHQNLTNASDNASDNAVFRSSVNKDEQDLPVRKKEQRQRRLQERRLQLRFRTFGSFGLLQYKVIRAINNTWSLTMTFLLKGMWEVRCIYSLSSTFIPSSTSVKYPLDPSHIVGNPTIFIRLYDPVVSWEEWRWLCKLPFASPPSWLNKSHERLQSSV